MTDELLKRYTTRHPAGPAPANDEPDDLIEEAGCFGYLRGVKERAAMLELRKRDGNILAISYSWIDRIEFDPSTGKMAITAITTSNSIRVKPARCCD